MRPLPLLLLIACAACTAAAFTSFCDDSNFHHEWADEFNGDHVDRRKWTVRHGTSVGECREAFCRAENVHVANGKLHLTSRRENYEGRNYTSGAVFSRHKASWNPANGTFRACVKAQLPGVPGKAQGMWPAHWMMPEPHACDPDLGEMDILEMIDGNGYAHSTYHWETTYPKHPCSYPVGHKDTSAAALLTNWNASYHEFAVERGVNHLVFAVDGVPILNTSAMPWEAPLFWSVPFYMILNTAVGGGWPGNPTPETVFPVVHSIDYVRVVRRNE